MNESVGAQTMAQFVCLGFKAHSRGQIGLAFPNVRNWRIKRTAYVALNAACITWQRYRVNSIQFKITSHAERLLKRGIKNDIFTLFQTFGTVRNNFAMRKLLWSVIFRGWTWCPSGETSFTTRGETIEAVPPTGWWSGRTEPLCWTGRRFRPQKNPTRQHHRQRTETTDCQVPPVTVAYRDARRPGLGGAAVRGVPLAAGQTPATPHPWSPPPRRAERMSPWRKTRI